MNIVITGAAGFIGSHLSEALLKLGHTVTGIDHLEQTPNRSFKENNLIHALEHPGFHWLSMDLLNANLEQLVADVDIIFHLAGLAGVRNSWGDSFTDYLQANVLLTQRILDACRKAANLKKLVYASSSSVYGGSNEPYSSEQSSTQPISPYGLTKLAGEQLCALYHKQYGLPYTALRYFTVFGPRQRPDMGFHRFMKAALFSQSLTVYGNGEQTRDFTYVSDVVEANISAMSYSNHGNVFNIGGVERASVNEVIQKIEGLSGKALQLTYLPEQPGDPFATGADISLARAELGYNPIISLDEGMTKQWSYITKLYGNV
ncbi:NAD-dependent epimerase/dehydratase family protein [Paenibacillus psychroresistens]|uniref:NAD-dependent epimerase/dehydratase family protein n=1 Tax=Paenibacillus psychroresistens TaxID=1778678 RepID=A0A6B8RHR5_9BACL|nr:NAD-dependent epimerase/dehydratase family protein [Paenibacillus psychroresistens]QGQ94916.1 NAD-dependent epimerase/dehydratase family protein [Paenibacillus psychroresistens]